MRMRATSCSVLIDRARASNGAASTASGHASNHAFVNVVGSPTIRSLACVPSESSSPTRPYARDASSAASSVRAGTGRGSAASYPRTKRTSAVHAARSASSADASRQISTGSPSRGNTQAS